MCGIVGMAGQLVHGDKDVFNQMLFFCQLRGEDSTGVFNIPKDSPDPSIIKVVGTPDNLFSNIRFDRLTMYNSRALIGHCRKATIGKINAVTAHPFTYGSITGVHNGTLRNWRDLPGDSESMDSQTLFENMNRVGTRETIEAVDGAYALIWWDTDDETLNVLRNKERPLHYAFSADYKRILWASEAWMILIAADRCGFKLADLTPKSDKLNRTLPIDEDLHWKMKLGGRGAADAITFQTAETGHVEKLEGGVNKAKPAAPFHASTYRYPGYGQVFRKEDLDDDLADVSKDPPKDQQQPNALLLPGPTNTAAGSENTSSSSTNGSSKDATPKSTVILPPKPTLTLVQTNKSGGSASSVSGNLLIGNSGLLLNANEYQQDVDHHCMWCRKAHSFEDLKDDGKLGAWIDDETFICSTCLIDDLTAIC